MKYRIVMGHAICAVALILGACNSKSPETTESVRGEGLKAQGTGLPQDEGARPSSGVPELDPPLAGLDAPHFESFNFLVNRPLAHRVEHANEHPTVAIDASSDDFVRYIQGTHGNDWLHQAEVEGGVVAGTRGRNARMWVPALHTDGANVIRARIFNPARGHNYLTVTLNDTKLPQVSLEEGWQVVSIPIEAAGALRSDNRLDVSFSNMGRIGGVLSGGGIAWLRIGKEKTDHLVAQAAPVIEDALEAARGAMPPEADEDQGGTAGQEGAAPPAVLVEEESGPSSLPMEQGPLTLEAEQGLSWVVWLPQDVKLDLEVKAREGCGPAVDLHVEAGKGEIERKLSEVRNLVLGRGEIQETAIDLSEFSGQVARIDIRPSTDCTGPMTLQRAALVVPGEKPTIPEGVEKPKYILFWVIDTLRADYLPIHFVTDVQAPHLKRLAGEGASFRVAYVQGTESRASHASLFTGQYPSRHGVMARNRVNLDTTILSQYMQEAGYKTGVVAANGYLSHLLNLNRGWDFYRNLIHEETAVGSSFLSRAGMQWALENKDEPFFLYLGTIDPHVTYRRHEEFIGLYDDDANYTGRFRRHMSGEDLGLVKARKLPLDDREKLRVINLYKNEITFNDSAFGYVREQLEEAGIWDQTMVVVTSDHGEEFWEHGSVGHGHNVHQEMVHVPMFFYYPPLIPAGTVVDAGADVIDIMATVLDIIGVDRPEGQQGKSVLPLIFNQHGGYPEPAVATQYMLHYAMQLEDWKIYMRRGEFRVYDRRTDILELEDVGDDHPLATRWLLDSMSWFRAHRARWDKHTWGVASNLSPEFLELLGGD